jgi:hypothetical protein
MDIKPIQTRYNGRLFRSRLEARWAVYFDKMGIRYVYEPQTFYLPEQNAGYLPDFYLPDMEIYAEIKPDKGFLPPCGLLVGKRFHTINNEDWNKIVEFSESQPLILIFGESFGQKSRVLGHENMDETIIVVENGKSDLWCCGGDEDFSSIEPYKSARCAALSHRFETNRS